MISINALLALASGAFVFLDPDQTRWMLGLNVAAAFVSGPSPVLLWAMYADAADYSEWKNHRRATGLVFSAATFSQKMGCAVGAAMTGFALDFFEYTPPVDGVDQAQSDTTLKGLVMMMSLIPAGFFFLAAACLIFYNLTESLVTQMEHDLQERKSTNEPNSTAPKQ